MNDHEMTLLDWKREAYTWRKEAIRLRRHEQILRDALEQLAIIQLDDGNPIGGHMLRVQNIAREALEKTKGGE